MAPSNCESRQTLPLLSDFCLCSAEVMKTAEHSAKHKVLPGGPCDRADSPGCASLKLALVSWSLPCLSCSIAGHSSVLTQEKRTFYQPPDAQATTPNILVSSLLTSKSTLSHQALTYCASCRSVSRVLLCPMCTTAMWVGPAHNYSVSALWTSLSAGSFP